MTEADAWQIEGSSLALEYRLAFVIPGAKPVIVNVKRTFTPLGSSKDTSGAGVDRGSRCRDAPRGRQASTDRPVAEGRGHGDSVGRWPGASPG